MQGSSCNKVCTLFYSHRGTNCMWFEVKVQNFQILAQHTLTHIPCVTGQLLKEVARFKSHCWLTVYSVYFLCVCVCVVVCVFVCVEGGLQLLLSTSKCLQVLPGQHVYTGELMLRHTHTHTCRHTLSPLQDTLTHITHPLPRAHWSYQWSQWVEGGI